MDNFAYKYEETLNSGNNNRLSWVDDLAGASLYADADIDNSMNSGNYEYDKLGQLISDADEGIDLEWRYGDKKLHKIDKGSEEITFIYNPFGQRVMKTISGTVDDKTTYYSYDANGQVMAVYNAIISEEENTAHLIEQHIYGASRLGMIKVDKLLYDNGDPLPEPGDVLNHTLGIKYYELSNYLGNVEAVITDRKTWNNTDDLYEAVVINTADYYPGGFLMPGRSNGLGDYRFGYNGMEMDNEVSGNGNSYTTEFRQYDPRLMRWKSLDPLMHQFPWMSPYVAFNNNPICYRDPLGLAAEGVDPTGDNGVEVGIEAQDNISWNYGNSPSNPNQNYQTYNIDPVFNNKMECLLSGADVPSNVFITVREKGSFEDVTSTYRKDAHIEGEFLMLYANSLQEGNQKRNDYLGSTKSPNTLLNLHGESESVINEFNQLEYTGNVSVNNDDNLQFDKYDVNSYLRGNLKGDVKNEIDAFISLMNATNNNCLLLSCRAASDATLVKRMGQLYNSSVTSGANLYMNGDYTSVYFYRGTNSVDLHSEPMTRAVKAGWIRININGTTFLINNGNNSGNIILDGFSTSPVTIESKNGL